MNPLNRLQRNTRRLPILIGLALMTLTGCATATSEPSFALSSNASQTPLATTITVPTATPIPIMAVTVASTPTLNQNQPSTVSDSPTVPVAPSAITITRAPVSPTQTPPTATPIDASPGDPPPLAMLLPLGWRATYTTTSTVDDQRKAVTINVAGYGGPLANGGTGFIYILWNYPSLVPVNPATLPNTADALTQAQLYSDGLRYLQNTILDPSCTVGNYGHQTFMVGGQVGVGQMFQSSQCPDNSPDVAGWYAGLNVNGQHLLFYAYIQPVGSFLTGRADLQKILDGVIFHVPTPISPSGDNTPVPGQTGTPVTPATTAPTASSGAIPTGTPVLN